jgi:hypothetical protein
MASATALEAAEATASSVVVDRHDVFDTGSSGEGAAMAVICLTRFFVVKGMEMEI